MCGIFISVGLVPDRQCLAAAAHRGPDGEGWREFSSAAGPVVLGHRRLAIIDLDPAAAQPMADAEGRFWLILNGEIYNYRELRHELSETGVRFRTQSDSEVLLEGYRRWREAVLGKLVGMFAFAIWDDREKTLFLARDRLGIKPLICHAGGGGLAFASEVAQLVGLQSFGRDINERRVCNFLAHGVSDLGSETMFADAFNFPAAHALTLDLNNALAPGRLDFARYWKAPRPAQRRWTAEEASEAFRERFDESLRLHLRADVRVGSCLSGGLDSSAIVAGVSDLLQKQGVSESMRTITAVYPGTPVDERRHAEIVARKAGVDAYFVSADPNVFELADVITLHQGEPYGSTSVHSQWAVFAEAARRGVKVMLDGQGADEILGGYYECYYYHYRRALRQFDLVALAKTLGERKAWHGASVSRELAPFIQAVAKRMGGGARGAAPWLRPDVDGRFDGGLIPEILERSGRPAPRDLGEYCLMLTEYLSLPMLLRYEDRSSMAHSIEARVPFLDHRLVEFALELGPQHKIVGGQTKSVLRNAMRDRLPPEIVDRRDKLGFATPEAIWFRGPLKGQILDAVENTLRAFPDLLDAEETRRLVRATLEGEGDVHPAVWRIVSLGIWARVFRLR
jgi:asparagine synthase (glutamine-hydrolysing)